MSKNMTGKWVLLIIAFIMSCLIWYMVITSDDPRVNISLGNVEVELLNLDVLHEKGLACYVEENSSIEVKVNVVQERGWLVKPDDIRITADLGQINAVRTVLPVTAQVINNQTIIGSNYKLSANSITVRTEKLLEKEIPVVIHTEGEPEDNCSIGACVPESSSIRVQVPESLYDQIVSAEGTVDISGRSADYEGKVELSFFDAEGKTIDCSEQQILPEKDSVSVKIPIGITKIVPIQSLSGIGTCIDGYRCTAIEADKASVEIFGPEEIVKSMESISIPASRISLEDRSESFELEVDLNEFLPEGVTVYDPDNAELQISVTIERLETKTYTVSSSNINIKNLDTSLKAVISSAQIQMMIRALPGDLEKLEADQIVMTLDLSGLGAGTHQVQPEYSFEDADGDYKVISLEKAAVVITES